MQMENSAIIDLEATPPQPPLQDPTTNRPKTNSRKRKKEVNSKLPNPRTPEEKLAQIETLEKELEGLFGYYREVSGKKVVVDLKQCGGSRNAVVAALMEESELPLSKLVDDVYGRLNSEVANGGVVLVEGFNSALVKSSVLFVGQRMMYGVPNADADILEDHSDSCLWCWETRDVKLLPKSVRGELVIRRTMRKKINERIMAVTEMIGSLKKHESEPNYSQDLIKASKKLNKTSTGADIHLIVEGLLQKNNEDMDKKKASQEEKLLIKQLDRNRREAEKAEKEKEKAEAKEKEKESMQCDIKTETTAIETNLKLSQGEVRSDEKCCEQKKQQKRLVEEAEKEQRRREKEEAELKKKRNLQKQVSIMERFLKRSKPNPSVQNDKVSVEPTASDFISSKDENLSKSATLLMDDVLASSSDISPEDLRRSHFSSWRSLGQSIRSNRKQRWGLRQNPKIEAVNKLKLTDSKAAIQDYELGMENDVDQLGGSSLDFNSCLLNADGTNLDAKKYHRGRQLLQFDNAPRPAFYGFWPSKSDVVGARHPLRKDPNLDYEVSSDEEWEEEEPGESLSDCEKDEEKDEEECQEECSKSDGESEDGFFVPDGYLSEDEGAQLDKMETDVSHAEADSSLCSKDDIEAEEFCALLRQQKYLNNLTEHALRKNNPVIIPNFILDKDPSVLDHNNSGIPKQELLCLQALSMHTIPGGSCIELELSTDKIQDEDQEASPSTGKGAATPPSDLAAIPDTDLPIIVTTIQNCSQGINKLLRSLQQKFPSASKSSLRNKVREVSDYVDNRWQVKKEVLVKLGLSVKPEKSSGGPRSIAAFFSKRCLPPGGESVKPGETSPLTPLKSCSAIQDPQTTRSHNI
ncbi:chromatin assembly factor 1 subunit FAS1-like [Vicia villosa]|uniref:chromatin assembly factor 1 subunit FAS1-like n=1 Tax=Vicia villosa TaxID=3911 RepID=UPI00273CA44E|nr:chromatin assembly factor 1 subunit FAS1-like [Vicia villosa]